MIIINGKVYTEKRMIENGYVETVGERIVGFGDMQYAPSLEGKIVIDAQGNSVIPGFIDQHIHGANGSDHMDATEAALSNIAKFIPQEGTTSYLPTTMTQSVEAVTRAVSVIADYMAEKNKPGEAEMLGIHLEGPFISKLHVGAQNPNFVQKPTIAAFDHYWTASKNTIKLVTFAPEEAEPGFIDHLCANGVVPSAGHTDSGYQEIMEAVSQGLSNLTHFHNAMKPHHHRTPGAVTAGFVSTALQAEMIVDGIHIHKDTVYATYKIKGADHVIGITDAMRAKGLKDGVYDLGGQNVIKKGMECRLQDGTLAGSVAEMDFIARNLKDFTGCTMEELIKMTSTNSALQLGVYGRKGSINIGKDADIVIVNDNVEVQTTICRGVIAYQK